MSEAACPTLETDRLLLRIVTLDDAAAFTKLITAPISSCLANWPFPFTHEIAVDRIESFLKLAASGDALSFVVIEKASSQLAGWVLLKRDDSDARKGLLGYWMG